METPSKSSTRMEPVTAAVTPSLPGETPSQPASSIGGSWSDEVVGLAVASAGQIFGPYRLLEEIAPGGMGVVFRARHEVLGRDVALKLIRSGILASPREVARFYREAKAVAQLRHPHVVQLLDFGCYERQHFFTMALAPGGSLNRHLVRYQADIRQAVALVEKIARALVHIHGKGLLHRDLKPGNILLDENYEPLVSDFGLARLADADIDLTRTGEALGTPAYMAPEQAAGRHNSIGPRTDIWALGVILYELVCGIRPFSGPSRDEMLRAIREQDPSSPRTLKPHLDRNLETILLKCLEKNPGRRYPSAALLADDLSCWLRGEPIRARPLSWPARAWRGLRRHPRLAAVGAVLALLAAATLFLSDRLDPDRPMRALQADLKAGAAIQLVGDSGGPGWHRWRGAGAFVPAQAGEPCALQAAELGLLELLADPKIASFRLRAQMHHHPGSEGTVGLYFGLAEDPGGRPEVLRFFKFTFADRGHHVVDDPKTGAKKGPASLRLCLIARANVNDLRFEPVDLLSRRFAALEEPDVRRWRQLEVRVKPLGIEAIFDGESLGHVPWSTIKITADHSAQFARFQHGFPGVPATAAGGVGIYVHHGGVSIRNVTLEPEPGENS